MMVDEGAEVEFFGARIKVRSAHLAALLNSDLTEDVVVVGKRAVDLVAGDNEEVEPDVAQWQPAGPVTADEDEDA
jgi:hypothetical protein